MKNLRIAYALVCMILCLVVAPYQPKQSTWACNGGPPCVNLPTSCLKSIVLTKAIRGVQVVRPAQPVTFGVPVTLFIACPTVDNCGAPCPGGTAMPLRATITIAIGGVVRGTLTIPGGLTCSATGTFSTFTIPVTIPAGTPPGIYPVVGTTAVTFAGPPPVGGTITATGDTVVCLVDPAFPADPNSPPRLDVQLVSDPFPRSAPGDQAVAEYLITNNDPNFAVTLNAFATAKQNAVRPQGQNELQGTYAISASFGDDFPIVFDPNPEVCIPLPPHPYTQPEIRRNNPLTLGPGDSIIVRVAARSYGQCRSGSCSESTMRVEGTFADGRRALGCAAMSYFVDTDMPTMNCGDLVNDCDGSGIYDAVKLTDPSYRDIYHDRNFNAMPDECEPNYPNSFFQVQQVSLQCCPGDCSTVRPDQPILVTLRTNMPAAIVFANGLRLVQASGDGQLWRGNIPSGRMLGPQTVYVLARHLDGRMAGQSALYEVGQPAGR